LRLQQRRHLVGLALVEPVLQLDAAACAQNGNGNRAHRRRSYRKTCDRARDALKYTSEFEFLVASLTAPQGGWFSLVKGRAAPPDKSALGADGMLDLAAVYSAYR